MIGKLITFEGSEGAGKSVIAQQFYEYLQSLGIECILTREPGGTPFAERVRSLLLAHDDVLPISQFLLFAAARIDHYQKIICPALMSGKIVICDRFTDSSVAYQCGGYGVDKRFVDYTHTFLRIPQPDRVYLLRVKPEIAIERIRQRGKLNHFDAKTMDFFTRVNLAYEQIAKQSHVLAIDNNDSGFDKVMKIIKEDFFHGCVPP